MSGELHSPSSQGSVLSEVWVWETSSWRCFPAPLSVRTRFARSYSLYMSCIHSNERINLPGTHAVIPGMIGELLHCSDVIGLENCSIAHLHSPCAAACIAAPAVLFTIEREAMSLATSKRLTSAAVNLPTSLYLYLSQLVTLSKPPSESDFASVSFQQVYCGVRWSSNKRFTAYCHLSQCSPVNARPALGPYTTWPLDLQPATTLRIISAASTPQQRAIDQIHSTD